MTEYDYSPDAYERYVAKQLSIARWVDDTNQFVPANPFVPPTPAPRSRALQPAYDARPPPTRSKTAPTPVPAHQARPAHSRRSSNAHSPTAHRPSASVSHLPDSASSRTHTSSRTHSSSRQTPHRSNTAPAYAHPVYIPAAGRSQAVFLPPGGQYMVVPPKGKRLDFNPQYYASPQQSAPYAQPWYPHTVPVTPQSPTKQQPLLKRLFTGLTRSGNKSSSRSKSRGHNRRNSF